MFPLKIIHLSIDGPFITNTHTIFNQIIFSHTIIVVFAAALPLAMAASRRRSVFLVYTINDWAKPF